MGDSIKTFFVIAHNTVFVAFCVHSFMDYYGNRGLGFSFPQQFSDIVIMIAGLYAAALLTVEQLLFHGADLIEGGCEIWVQAGCYYKYCTYIKSNSGLVMLFLCAPVQYMYYYKHSTHRSLHHSCWRNVQHKQYINTCS